MFTRNPRPTQLTVPFEHVAPLIEVGDIVELAGDRQGVIERVELSPYWPEERDGIQRAYVVNIRINEGGVQAWTDWCLPEEMKLLHKPVRATA
jgi:hypothetical protein